MEWNCSLSLLLIDEYKKFPILWNTKHPRHFQRRDKAEAWERLSQNLGVNLYDVKQKMNSLLGSLRRERAKGKITVTTSEGIEEKYVSKWFAFDKMKFLLDKDEDVNAENSDNEKTDLSSCDDVEYKPQPIFHILQNHEKSRISVATDENGESIDAEQIICEVTPNRKTKISSETYEEELKYSANALHSSHLDYFGKYVANKLMKYSENTRIEVEHAINEILYAADKGKYEVCTQSASPSTSQQLDGKEEDYPQ